jgi:hypothetical protein
MKALGGMLAADFTAHSDGGGKRPASMQPSAPAAVTCHPMPRKGVDMSTLLLQEQKREGRIRDPSGHLWILSQQVAG